MIAFEVDEITFFSLKRFYRKIREIQGVNNFIFSLRKFSTPKPFTSDNRDIFPV